VFGVLAALNIALIAAGWGLANRAGLRLRLRVGVPVAGDPRAPMSIEERNVTHPAGTGATWTVVYGVVYSVATWVAGLWLTTLYDPAPWQVVTVVASGAFSVVLLVVVPVVLPRRAHHDLVRSLRADTAALSRVRGGGLPDGSTVLERAVAELQRRGDTYSYLVDGYFRLTDEGRDLWRSASTEGDHPRPETPVSVHILGLVAGAWLAVPLLAPVALLLVSLGAVAALGCSVAEGRELGHPPSQEQQRWPGAMWAAGSAVGVLVVAAALRTLVLGGSPEWAGTVTLLAALALTAAAVVVAVFLRGRTATPAEVGMSV
jgi:hypothetical protein